MNETTRQLALAHANVQLLQIWGVIALAFALYGLLMMRQMIDSLPDLRLWKVNRTHQANTHCRPLPSRCLPLRRFAKFLSSCARFLGIGRTETLSATSARYVANMAEKRG
jgi:hypothetical protein